MPRDESPKDETDRKERETRGGYPAGGKQVSEFPPPPPGSAPGGRRPVHARPDDGSEAPEVDPNR
jgi:hypothetical protein